MRRTELRRTGFTQPRRTPLRPVSRKREQQNRKRVIRESELGRQGLHGTCARCGQHAYVNGHERRNRSQGGDPARPDCLLCIPCNGWVADNPQLACWTGWSVSPKWPHDHTLDSGEARDLDGCVVVFDHEQEAA